VYQNQASTAQSAVAACVLSNVRCCTYRVGQKVGHCLMTISLSNLNRFKKKFTGRFLGRPKFAAVKGTLKIPSHLAYVATLPCETLMSAEQAVNDKLQGNVATHLKCGGVANNQIKKGLLLSLSVNFFKSVNIWQSYKQLT